MFSKIRISTYQLYINILHMCNDGFSASYLLLLPFIAHDLHISIGQVGVLGSLFKIATIIFALPAGNIARKYGGLRSLLLACFLYGIGYIVTGLAGNFLMLIGIVFITGIGFGLFHPVGFGLIANDTKKEDMGKSMANFTATGDIGKIALSAGITFLITLFGWRATTITYGITTVLIYFLLNMFVTKFTQDERKEEELHKNQKPLLSYIANKHFMAVSIAGALDAFASSPFFLFLPFLLLEKGIAPAFIGTFTAIYLLGNFAGKTILGRVSDRLGSTKTFIFSEIGNVVFIFLLLLPVPQILIIVISFLLGTLTKGTSPVVAIFVTEALDKDDNYQQAFAVNTFILNIATIIGPFILGLLSDKFGLPVAFYAMAFATFAAIIPVISYAVIKDRHLSQKLAIEAEEEELTERI